jgi:zona occludens toxin (predicted ATPase)
MITFIGGRPGSGKSYYTIDLIHKKFLSKEEPFHLYLYQNLAKFNVDLLNYKLKQKNRDIKVYNFDFHKYMNHVKNMYSIHMDKDRTEEDLVQYSKDHKLYKALIIIDEAHLYLDKRDKYITFLLTYHRHWDTDIYILSQQMNLIHYKNLATIENYIIAQRRTLSLKSNKFKYFHYSNEQFTKDNIDQQEELSINEDYFEYYQSGGGIRAKNIYKPLYIKMGLALVVVSLAVLLFIKLFFGFIEETGGGDYLGSEEQKKVSSVNNVGSSVIKTSMKNIASYDNVFLELECSFYKDINYCIVMNDRDNYINKQDIPAYKADYVFSKMLEQGYKYNYSHYTGTIQGVQFFRYEYIVDPLIIYTYFNKWYKEDMNKDKPKESERGFSLSLS